MAEQTTESTKTTGFRQAFAQTNDSKAFHNKVRGNNKNTKGGKFKKKSLDVFKKYYDGAGAINSLSFNGKYCFSIKEQSEDFKKAFEEVVEVSTPIGKTVDFNWIVSHYNPTEEELSKAKGPVDFWRQTLGEEQRFASYGEASISVDFSKLDLLKEEHSVDNILYPYGIFFFSDEPTPRNHLRAAVACYPDRFNRMKFNNNFEPITDYTNVNLNVQFRNHGRFVIFFVGAEEYKEDLDIYVPDITTIVIEVTAEKEDGIIKKISVTDSAEYKTTADYENNEDFAMFMAKKVYYRYVTPFGANTHTIADYLFIVGGDPRNYDLSIPNTPKFEKAIQAIEEKKAQKKSNSDESEKPTGKGKKSSKGKGKKTSKKDETAAVTSEEAVTVAHADDEQISADDALDACPTEETIETTEQVNSDEAAGSEEN